MSLIKPIGDMNEVDALRALVLGLYAPQSTSGAAGFPQADISNAEYETVAAGQNNIVLGNAGGTGDFLTGFTVIPATTSPGAITITDGNLAAVTIFTGGATSVSNLVPFFIPIGARSVVGKWAVTTGANVSVIATGNFS